MFASNTIIQVARAVRVSARSCNGSAYFSSAIKTLNVETALKAAFQVSTRVLLCFPD
jgi:hypothetical protein